MVIAIIFFSLNSSSSEHYSYSSHNCPVAYKKDVQVPVCPLCNRLVPGKADELPDIRVSRHIDSDCSSDTAVSRRKVHFIYHIYLGLRNLRLIKRILTLIFWPFVLQTVFTNKCSLKGCKQKELVPVVCDKCNQNFCLRHRHPVDHSCSNASGKSVSKAGQAALSRTGQTGSSVRTSAAANTGAGINPRNLLSGITSFRSGNSSRPQGTALSQNLNSLQGNVVSNFVLTVKSYLRSRLSKICFFYKFSVRGTSIKYGHPGFHVHKSNFKPCHHTGAGRFPLGEGNSRKRNGRCRRWNKFIK